MKRFVSWWLVAVLAVYPLVPVSAQAADDEDDDAQEQTVTRGGDSGEVKLDGYAEYWRNGILIVDGQRVVASGAVELKGDKKVRSFGQIPLGYEVKVKGMRQSDGSVLARAVEAKPNGIAMFENLLVNSFDQIESNYRHTGHMYEANEQGRVTADYGRLITSGPRMARLKRIISSLIPPSQRGTRYRLYVVENDDWNAMCAPNHSIYVYTGLMDDMDDDELAIIVAHELAHSTHEHSRRAYKKQILVMLATVGVALTANEVIKDDKAKAVAAGLLVLGASAWRSGYGRKNEDQADRVGLRYAYMAGFDVHKGPRMWGRFANKYGSPDKVTNFFFGDHSVARDRERNLNAEIALNYRDTAH